MSRRVDWQKLAREGWADDAAAITALRTPPEEELDDGLDRPARAWSRLRHSLVWYLLRRQTPWIVAMLVLGAAVFGLTMLGAETTASIFDDAIGDRSRSLEGLVALLAVIGVAEFAVGLANRQVSARVGYQLEFDLRNLLYLRLQRAAPKDLDAISTGQMVTRALTDLRVLEAVIRLVPELMRALPILLGVLVYLFLSSVPLTLVAVSAIPLNAYLVNRIRTRLWGLAYLSLDQKAEVTAAIDEPVRGIRVVKAFVAEEAENRKVAAAASAAYRYVMTRVRLEARFDLLLRAAPVLVRAGLLLFGARLAVAGHLSLGQFTVFFMFSAIFSGIAQSIDELVAAWQMAKSGVGRIFELLNMAPRGARSSGVRGLPAPSVGLEASQLGVEVSGRSLLGGLDLRVGPGELVVVAGPPGSGKSMLAAVLVGDIPPAAGEVRLEGVPIGELAGDEVAREVRVLGDEPFLFARSLRDNLLLGSLRHPRAVRLAVPDEVLLSALEAAGADDVLGELPEGLDSVIGDRGMTLSGGQRQRVALARALVNPPRILILDDALSAVNPALEVQIIDRVRARAPEMGLVCVSRRLGLRALADRVIELGPQPVGVPGGPSTEPPERRGTNRPYDPRLGSILAEMQVAGDEPRVDEEVASDSERPPNVRNTIAPVAKWVVLASVVLVAMTGVSLAPDYVLGNAADAIDARDTAQTDRYALLLVLLALGSGLLSYSFRIAANRVNQDILYTLRRRIFARLSRMGIDYYDRELPGSVSARVVHDLDVLSGFFEDGAFRLVSSVALFAMVLAVMALISPDVTVLVLCFAAGVAVVTLVQVPVADRAFLRARLATGRVVARLQEDFAGRYVVRSMGAERQARLDFGHAALELRNARRWATTTANIYTELVSLLASIGAALTFLRAGNLALSGALSVGTVLTLRLYLQEAMRPIPTMGRVWQDYLQARVALKQLAQPYEAEITPHETPDALACPPLEGRISFESVGFGYPGTRRTVLDEVSLEIQPGEVVALVGNTGAGKSSVAKLLARTYDPDAGTIRIDGRDLRRVTLASLRRRIGVVPQDAFVFRGTIASNIAYGRPDAEPSELLRAIEGSGVASVLGALPGGLETFVEEEGRNLTTSVRQAVALARAWLLDPDVLVLDEATSALDTESEARVLDAVNGRRRTAILVAHRLTVASAANRVLVLEQGRITASGTHDELLESSPGYAGLWSTVASAVPGAAR